MKTAEEVKQRPTPEMSELAKRKLEDLDLKLSPDQQVDLIKEYLDFGRGRVRDAKDKDLVVILGNTGAAKSTTLNYLSGCQLEQIRNPETKTKIIQVAPGSPVEEKVAIGHTNRSMTFIPEICKAPQGELWFCDCPGFSDRRGPEINISNAVNIKRVIAAARSARVLVMINYSSLKADRGKGVADVLTLLGDLFGKVDKVEAPSVLICITRAPIKEDDDELNTCKDILAHLKDFGGLDSAQKVLMSALSERAGVYHPMDKAHDTWWKRKDFLDAIQALQEINDPAGKVHTVLNAEDERALQSIVQALVGCGNTLVVVL